MKEDIVLITSYTEGNIAALVSYLYYSGSGYNMSKKTISFLPRVSDWVSGRVKVRLYFVKKGESRGNKIQAVSNVLTFYISFFNGTPHQIEL